MSTAALLKELDRTRDETLTYFTLGNADLDRTYGPGKWSVRFVLHHLSDSERVFADRISRVLSEPPQVIWVYDQDAWAKGLAYQERPLPLSKGIFEVMRTFNARYAGIHYDRSASLEFVHSATGVRTLKDEFDKIVNHTEHHLAQIRKALKA